MIDSQLEAAIRSAWSKATAVEPTQWTDDNPAAGHCDVTALAVRERGGGDLVQAQVFRDGELSEHHYWNMLPDGTELDLTREQFDGAEDFGEPHRMDDAFFAQAGPMQPSLIRRFALFNSRLDASLNAAVEERRP